MRRTLARAKHPNFRTVWATLQENSKQLKEWQQKYEKSRLELAEQQKETDRKMQETNRQISKLGNSFGEMVEHMVAPSIMRKFNERGFEFSRCCENQKVRKLESPNIVAEVDILLENGDIAIAVEVKAKPKQPDVDEHIERLQKLRETARGRYEGLKYQGAIAGAIMDDSVRNYALKQGLYVIEQTGDTVMINIPEDFKPREW
jgi:hypothetical protein